MLNSLWQRYQQLQEEFIVPMPTMQQLRKDIQLEIMLLGNKSPKEIIKKLNASQELHIDNYLRMALDADPKNFNALVKLCDEEPRRGGECLAIFGSKHAAEYLLSLLKHASHSGIVAPAWRWLTGQQLPLKPILPTINAPKIPDYEQALSWWAEHSTNWPADQRRIAGKPLNKLTIKEQKLVWSAKAGLVLDMLYLRYVQ